MMAYRLPLIPNAERTPGSDASCDATRIHWCSFTPCSRKVAYHIVADDDEYDVCSVHYRAGWKDSLASMPNTIGLPEFVPYGAQSEVRIATADELKAIEKYINGGDWNFAGFAEYDTHPDTEYNGVPIMPKDGPWIVLRNQGQVDAIRKIGNLWKLVTPDGIRMFTVAARCAVCGKGGSTPYTILVGNSYRVHRDCYKWMVDNPDIVGWNVYACGHTFKYEPPVDRPEETERDTFICEGCGDEFRKESVSQDKIVDCPTCARFGGNGFARYMMEDHQSVRCLHCAFEEHVRKTQNDEQGSHPRLIKMGVRADRSLLRSLADTYTLVDLSLISERAEPMLAEHAEGLAEQFYNYITIAAGGELRHMDAESQAQLRVEVKTATRTSMPQDEEERRQYVCINHRMIGCKYGVCWQSGYVYKMTGQVFGAVNSPSPQPRRGANYVPVNGPLTLDGVTYDAYHPDAQDLKEIQKALTTETGQRPKRHIAWEQWYELCSRPGGHRYMEICASIFNHWAWGASFGGPKWGQGADIAVRYKRGEISALHFVDLVFGLQHNGGSFLNKCYPTEAGGIGSLQNLLDIKRRYDSAEYLLYCCSPAVLDLWCEVADETGNPELVPGAEAIRKHRDNGGAGRSAAFRKVINTVRKEMEDDTSSDPAHGLARTDSLHPLRAAA